MTKPVKDRVWGYAGVLTYFAAQLLNDVAGCTSGLNSSRVCLNMQVSEDHSSPRDIRHISLQHRDREFSHAVISLQPHRCRHTSLRAKNKCLGGFQDEYVVKSVRSSTCSSKNASVNASGSARRQGFVQCPLRSGPVMNALCYDGFRRCQAPQALAAMGSYICTNIAL